VPKVYQDECCPRPAKEVLDREGNKKRRAKGKQKQEEKKEKGKMTVALPPKPAVTTMMSSTNDPREVAYDAGTYNIKNASLSPSK
jgi:hypothetical protein